VLLENTKKVRPASAALINKCASGGNLLNSTAINSRSHMKINGGVSAKPKPDLGLRNRRQNVSVIGIMDIRDKYKDKLKNIWAPGYTRHNFMNGVGSPVRIGTDECSKSPWKDGHEADTTFSRAAIKQINMKKYAI
jgi:hypothetical protein